MHVPAISVSERDLHDTYLPAYRAFQVANASWHGGQGGRAEAIMCSYAAFDGIPSCANSRLLRDILRGEWGSDALVQSDCCDSISSIWNQHHYAPTLADAVAMATNAGTQLCFACGQTQIAAYQAALAAGQLHESQLDADVARMLLTRFRLGEFDPQHPFANVDEALIDCPAHRALAREVAAASIVLAVNRGNMLPLRPGAHKAVAIIGPFADCGDCYLHSYNGHPSYIISYLDAVREVAGAQGASVAYANGSNVSAAVAAAATADLVIVCLGLGSAVEAEGRDRHDLGFPPDQQQLLAAVREAAAGGRAAPLVLVSVSAGGVPVNTSLVDALFYAGYGGQEAGHGLTDVLWGAVSPSARLPVTVYAPDYVNQVGGMLDYNMTSGVGRTYRYLNNSASPPLFHFGFGLSYSHFHYSDLQVTLQPPTQQPEDQPSNSSAVFAHATATVTNVGAVAAAEVCQLYVYVPQQPDVVTPAASLQGFNRVLLAPGASARLSFSLTAWQMGTVATDGSRSVRRGSYTISVGGHQPGDPAGAAVSDVASATLVVDALHARDL